MTDQNPLNNQQTSSDNKKSEKKNIAFQLFLIVFICVLFVVISSILIRVVTPDNTDKEKVEEVVDEIIKEKDILISRPNCELNFEGYNKLLDKKQSVEIVKNKSSFAVGGQFSSNITPTIQRSGSGEIACGYLYVRVSKNKKSLNKDWDSIYINPHEFGGHLLRPKSIMNIDKEKYTEVLFSLDSISYLEGLPYNPDATNFKIANWINLLNVNNHTQFHVGLSTGDQGGLIEEIRIAYNCWNPETGEETQTCQLSLDK